MSRSCLMCNSMMIQVGAYLICENCKIAIPDEKAIIERQLQEMDNLRKELQVRLHDLYQKKISNQNNLTSNEKIEFNIWEQHNELYINLNFWLKSYDVSSDVRLREVYPRIYDYLIIVQKIKNFYEITNKKKK